MRLLVDMNLTPRWVQALEDSGYEAVHWSSVGDPEASDSRICSWSRDRGHIVITNDLDFRKSSLTPGLQDQV